MCKFMVLVHLVYLDKWVSTLLVSILHFAVKNLWFLHKPTGAGTLPTIAYVYLTWVQKYPYIQKIPIYIDRPNINLLD